jgi:CRP-like cAMP-binding protein
LLRTFYRILQFCLQACFYKQLTALLETGQSRLLCLRNDGVRFCIVAPGSARHFGIIAIVLGLALQSTLGDVFSGLSLSIEKLYRIGDEILLEGGAAGEARSQLITQVYKRARPVVAQRESSQFMVGADASHSYPIFLFPENQVFDHLPLLESLSDAEKAHLNAQISRCYFQVGEQLLAQNQMIESVHFVFSGMIQVTRQVKGGRVLKVRRLGPGDSYGEIALLTGTNSSGTYTALTSGLLLGLQAADLKPILEARPELVESLSHSATKLQQFVTTCDRAAIQPVAFKQRDLLCRIRSFFHLEVSS